MHRHLQICPCNTVGLFPLAVSEEESKGLFAAPVERYLKDVDALYGYLGFLLSTVAAMFSDDGGDGCMIVVNSGRRMMAARTIGCCVILTTLALLLYVVWHSNLRLGLTANEQARLPEGTWVAAKSARVWEGANKRWAC